MRYSGLAIGLVVVVMAAPVHAQTTKGSFAGTIEPAPGISLRLALHLSDALEGSELVGTLDSLDQGARGIAISGIVAEGGALRFAVPAVGGNYEGQWDGARGAWVGTWSQGGAGLPLVWTPSAAPTRPLLKATAGWKIPESAGLIDPLVASSPVMAIAVGTVSETRIQTTVRGGTSQPASAATRFEIGSLTKLFTDLLLADMVVRGEVKLSDPVRNLLPTGVLADGGNRPITLADLATHYSGLPRLPANLAPADPTDPYADYDEAKLYAFLRGWRPDRKPGAMFEYSNLGVGLLGHALARHAGQPYEQLIKERVLRPLGMNDTDFSDRNLATPRGSTDAAVKPWAMSSLAAAGGLRSTIGDMTRFAAALLNPPKSLRPAVRIMLDYPARPAGGSNSISLGLLSVPTTVGPVLNHDGGTGGMRSSLYLDTARQRGVVVLANRVAGRSPGSIAIELLAGVKPEPAAAAPR